MPVRQPVTAEPALPLTVHACTSPIAARRIVEAAFRDPLTPAEKAQAPGTRTAITVTRFVPELIHHGFDLRRTWGARDVRSVRVGTPLRPRCFPSPGAKTSPVVLAEAFTRIFASFTGA